MSEGIALLRRLERWTFRASGGVAPPIDRIVALRSRARRYGPIAGLRRPQRTGPFADSENSRLTRRCGAAKYLVWLRRCYRRQEGLDLLLEVGGLYPAREGAAVRTMQFAIRGVAAEVLSCPLSRGTAIVSRHHLILRQIRQAGVG